MLLLQLHYITIMTIAEADWNFISFVGSFIFTQGINPINPKAQGNVFKFALFSPKHEDIQFKLI